jgi:hypothetical protein
MTTVTQIFFNGKVFLLMLVSVAIAIVFSLMVFMPETYEFGEKDLTIKRAWPKKVLVIPYENILKYKAMGFFRNMKRDFDSVEMVLTYTLPGKAWRKTISCHPKKVLAFVKLIQERCPNLEPDLDLLL